MKYSQKQKVNKFVGNAISGIVIVATVVIVLMFGFALLQLSQAFWFNVLP